MSSRRSDERPSPVWIGEGGCRQEGKLRLARCKYCGTDIVWATSRRTGRKYPASVWTGQGGARFYVKASPHKCDRPAPAGDASECPGHETTSGPIGSTVFCDGTCQVRS